MRITRTEVVLRRVAQREQHAGLYRVVRTVRRSDRVPRLQVDVGFGFVLQRTRHQLLIEDRLRVSPRLRQKRRVIRTTVPVLFTGGAHRRDDLTDSEIIAHLELARDARLRRDRRTNAAQSNVDGRRLVFANSQQQLRWRARAEAVGVDDIDDQQARLLGIELAGERLLVFTERHHNLLVVAE